MWRAFLGLFLAMVFTAWAQGDVDALLAQAEALYDRWHGEFDFVAYEARLVEAIRLWEEALPRLSGSEEKRAVWLKLSRAWFELAEGYFLEEGPREAAYTRGRDCALEALRLDPVFQSREREGFRAALQGSTDAEALFWYGNNLGRWLSFHWFSALAGGTRDVWAAFQRAAELDERYWGGGPRRALGNFYAQTPSFLGGDGGKVGEELARAVELDPTFLQNLVDYAEFWAKGRDEAFFCELLRKVLSAPDEVLARWPFYNHLARARAARLTVHCP